MSYNPIKTVAGIPEPVPVKCRIAGQAEVVDSLVKRVVLFDRRNMELLAVRNVTPDHTWELFSPDRGDGNHLLIGLDEGGNFNISGFDRASLGIHTYPVDTEGYEQAQPDKQAFYAAEMTPFNFDDLTPVKLYGELGIYAPVTGVYFTEDFFGAFGHFEDTEGTLLPVGAGTDYPDFTVGTSFKMGGQLFTIERLSDNVEMVFLTRPVGASKGDVFDNGSCIFHLPSVLSLVTTTGHTVAAGVSNYQSNAGGFIVGDTRLTDFYPDASMKTLSFNFQTDVASGQRMFLISIPGFLEIAVAEPYDYMQVATGNGVITNSVQIDLDTLTYFVCFCFSGSNTTVYVDNMTTVKATLPAVVFNGQSPLAINAQVGYGSCNPVSYKVFLSNIRAFNATLDATARTTLMGTSLNKTPVPLLVDVVSTTASEENIKSVSKKDIVTFSPYYSGISFFKNSPPVGFKVDLAATLKNPNPTIFDALNVGPNVIRVPQDYSTVVLAVAAAVHGDIILITPGTYVAQVTITDKIVHLIGDTDDPVGNPIRFTASNRALTLTSTDTGVPPDMYESFGDLPMVIQNITFTQAHTSTEGIQVSRRNHHRRLRFDFVNCSFTNTGYLFNFQYDTACIMRFFNCDFTRGASYNTFYNFRSDFFNSGIIELYKCRLYQAISINGTGTLTYNDSVLVATDGYGFSYPADYNLLSDTVVEPIYFSISPDILTEDQANVKIGIDLSLHPELFDEVSGTSDLSVIFQDGSFLDIEVETFDAVNKKGLLWVSLPVVSSSEITYFALIYESSDSAIGGPESDDAHNVWADYDVVYHMTDDPVGTGAVTNSASDSYHGTPSGMAISDRSYAPLSGYEYSFDGTKKITIADLYPAKEIEGTIEVVFKTTQTDGHILSQDADGWNDRDVNISIGDPTGVVSTVADGYLNFEAQGPGTSEVNNITSTVAVNDGQYHYAGVTWYRDNLGLVLDDAIDVAALDYKMWPGTGNVMVGTNGTTFLTGSIGEILIADTFKSAEYHRLINASMDLSLFSYSFGTNTITATFISAKALTNVPLKIDLEATGLSAGDIAAFLASPLNIIAASTTDTSLKVEMLDWATGVAAPLWVLLDNVAIGYNSITLTVGAGANSDSGAIGSATGQEVFQDFLAVYHLCQDPSVAIIDSTGNNSNAIPVNMDATNLVNGVTVFNGTDEALNLGALFDSVQNSGQIYMTIKTSQASAPLLMQGIEGVQLIATGAVKADVTNTMEGTTAVSDGDWHVVTVAHDLHKRDLFVDGVDEIPYGIFGSDGNSDVILGGNYLGSSFVGNIPEFRIKTDAEYQEKLILNGKLWKETLVDIPNDPQMIPVFSFDGGSTYSVWTGTWRAVASIDDAIHGETGNEEWHYISGEDTWFKSTINTLNEALLESAEYPENRNHVDTIYNLTSEEWTSTGGMSSDGELQCAFVFNSCIEGLCSAIENVTIDGNMVYGFGAIDLNAFSGLITGSSIGWSISITDPAYDYSQVQVYSCITGGTWQACTRDGAIPGITAGMTTTGLKVYFKAVAPLGLPENSKMVLIPRII